MAANENGFAAHSKTGYNSWCLPIYPPSKNLTFSQYKKTTILEVQPDHQLLNSTQQLKFIKNGSKKAKKKTQVNKKQIKQ